jgi:hypothetical protein
MDIKIIQKRSQVGNETIITNTTNYNPGVYHKMSSTTRVGGKDVPSEAMSQLIIVVGHTLTIIGISCYSIKLNYAVYGMKTPHICNSIEIISNIPYMPQAVLDMLTVFKLQESDIGTWISKSNKEYNFIEDGGYVFKDDVIPKIKKQIMDKLNEDDTFRQLSELNILHEIHELKAENEKLRGERFYQSSELSSMRRSIHQLHEDMTMLLATTSKIQQENIQLIKLLQEKEKTKQLSTTIHESQGLSFTHANTIGQALMSESDIFNCM